MELLDEVKVFLEGKTGMTVVVQVIFHIIITFVMF